MPYEILALLGSGGMGEVYRARDPRLRRDVAVKVMFASAAPDRIARFEQEARTAGALNHPNIVVVYDVGTHEGSPYVVSELLEGKTLRERLQEGPLNPRKAVDYALQIVRGLAAAHEKGIFHRDLKPENLFLTADGRAKILDFGLAKLVAPGSPIASSDMPTLPITEPGTVLGTVGYMSPEQVRGRDTDHRSDIFSFGVVLYEMLSGRRPFVGDSGVETMNAILREDPPPFPSQKSRPLPAGLERIVRHCLEKNPDERFQSARDLAFDLQELQEYWISSEPVLAAVFRPAKRWLPRLGTALALGALVLLAFVAGKALWQRPVPRFEQLTFRRGAIVSARFAPGDQGIVYAAAWDGRPMEVFLTRPDSPESRPLGYAGAKLAAISSSGEMALLLNYHYASGQRSLGTLARVPWDGTVARELVADVEGADWSPDGGNMAVARSGGVGSSSRLEYPPGTVLYQTTGSIRSPRISPQGDRVAFLDDPDGVRSSGSVAVVDRQGGKQTLTELWPYADGLAWSADGSEIWFTARNEGTARALRAVSRSGRQRLISEVPGSLALEDISRDGRVLLAHHEQRQGILALPPGESAERELSWFDDSALSDLSIDGRTLLFGDRNGVYLRRTDGSPAVRLGEGYADTLSPDGKWALSTTGLAEQLVLLPTGPGDARKLPRHGIVAYAGAWWFGDGRRILLNGREQGRGLRSYVQSLDGGAPRPITPEGTWSLAVGHDQRFVAAISQGQGISLYPVEGGEALPVAGSLPGDRPGGWSADGRSLWIFRRGEMPAPVYRVDLTSGRREVWKTLVPADPAGVSSVLEFRVTPDGRSYAYSYRRILSDLYLVEGLK